MVDNTTQTVTVADKTGFVDRATGELVKIEGFVKSKLVALGVLGSFGVGVGVGFVLHGFI